MRQFAKRFIANIDALIWVLHFGPSGRPSSR